MSQTGRRTVGTTGECRSITSKMHVRSLGFNRCLPLLLCLSLSHSRMGFSLQAAQVAHSGPATLTLRDFIPDLEGALGPLLVRFTLVLLCPQQMLAHGGRKHGGTLRQHRVDIGNRGSRSISNTKMSRSESDVP